LRLNAFHLAPGLLAAAMLSGCVATNGEGLAPSASLSSDLSSTETYSVALPDTVDVLPQPSGRIATGVGYAAPETLTASSFAGPQPAAVAMADEKRVFLDFDQSAPQPAAFAPRTRPFQLPPVAGGDDGVNQLIEKYAGFYEVPVNLVRRVVRRESNFRPEAINHGHWGLMQIKHATARGMGYDGPAKGLLDAETNLRFAVKYLAGAWLVAQGNPDLADRLYQRGYYYDAKRMGLLDETGLGHDRVRRRSSI
jgi:soluble lytic murein transglycosylase-like protein